jgi:hypothetical protein
MVAFPLFASNIQTTALFSKHQQTSMRSVLTVAALVHGMNFYVPHFSEYQLILGHSGALLGCKIHHCPLKCHRVTDHSRVRCEFPLFTRCAKGHTRSWKCHDGPPATCRSCVQEQKAAEKAKAELSRLRERRDTERSNDQHEMAQLDEQLARLTFGNGRIQGVQKAHLPGWSGGLHPV